MERTADAVKNAKKLLESTIEVLREQAGELAQNGQEDVSVDTERAASIYESAVALINLASMKLDSIAMAQHPLLEVPDEQNIIVGMDD